MPETVDGFDGLDDMFSAIDRDVQEIDWREFFLDQADRLEGDHKTYFDEARSPRGTPWAKLAASTIRRKGHDKILIDTGRLIKSLTQRGGDAIREPFVSGNMAGLVFGTSVPYAHFHMSGTRYMPARPEVGVTEERLQKLQSQVGGAVVETIIKPKGNF